ncbi:MAG: flagellar motor switch phosphatase FliY [Firmicutes bacterium]|nr:flagellar motor switch phosphatase FliY [Bacillota bacterium]
MADRLLMQEEIDALLSLHQTQNNEPEGPKDSPSSSGRGDDLLSAQEKDALGEIGNISMGSAATSLSEILNQKVSITSPRVSVTTLKEISDSFIEPYVLIIVRYTEGLQGSSLLLIKNTDMAVVADLMMGGDGQHPPVLGEMELSAGAEAMNQMVGAAATAMANVFGRRVLVAPPEIRILGQEWSGEIELGVEDPVVAMSFRMTIGELLDTEFIQIMGLGIAKEEAALLWHGVTPEYAEKPLAKITEEPKKAHVSPVEPADYVPRSPEIPVERRATFSPGINQEKLDLILDIPLKVTVVLGRTKRSIKDILSLGPGNIVELATLADEPVEVLVNGTLVARGEVVVVNENFGVQITSILTPQERLQHLSGKS